jgi:hypothetical protein
LPGSIISFQVVFIITVISTNEEETVIADILLGGNNGEGIRENGKKACC